MPIKECSSTNVITCGTDASVPEVAELMRRHHVGAVVVTAVGDGEAVPIGIVTDRDIVVETVALQLDVPVFTAGDIMTSPVVTVSEEEGIIEALRIMRTSSVRRLPVIDSENRLVGIVSSDDLLRLLSKEFAMMTDAIVAQREAESRLRRGYPSEAAGGGTQPLHH